MTTGQTPLTKLLRNLDMLKQEQEEGVMPPHVVKMVLIATGALCPIHTSHLEMLSQAKQHLESKYIQGSPVRVLAGYLSPSHDKYTRGKLKGDNIEAVHRVEMVRVATADSDWMDVDPWESLGASDFFSFVTVTHRLKDYLHEVLGKDIVICFVCGADLVVRAPNSFKRFDVDYVHVCAIARPNSTQKMKQVVENLGKRRKVTHFVEGVECDVSSTMVRTLLKQGKPLDTSLVPAAVGHYLYNSLGKRFTSNY